MFGACYSKCLGVLSSVPAPLKFTLLQTPNSIDDDTQPPPIVRARRRGRGPPGCQRVRGCGRGLPGCCRGAGEVGADTDREGVNGTDAGPPTRSKSSSELATRAGRERDPTALRRRLPGARRRSSFDVSRGGSVDGTVRGTGGRTFRCNWGLWAASPLD